MEAQSTGPKALRISVFSSEPSERVVDSDGVKQRLNHGAHGDSEKMNLLEEQLTEQIIGSAIEVHRFWGPGLYEEIYERSLCRELEMRGLAFERQRTLPLLYKGTKVGDNLTLDVCVEKTVVVENKHVKELLPIHRAQLMTYLKLTGCRVGLLINYNVPVLKDGIKRIVL